MQPARHDFRNCTKAASLLIIVAVCFFEYALCRYNSIFGGIQVSLQQVGGILFACVAVWCVFFLFFTWDLSDIMLLCLLLVAIVAGCTSSMSSYVITLLFGVTLGKGACFVLESESCREKSRHISDLRLFFIGLVVLLAFSSWWHLDMGDNFYHGPRWMGFWDNPNIYGMLMAVGLVLAIGLLVPCPKSKVQSSKSANSFLRHLTRLILIVAAGMMAIGLLFSYSRGSWLGAAVGLLYLAKAYGRFRWRYVLPEILVVAVIVWFFWNTPRTAPWYLQRLDSRRGSVQHRLAAWKAGFEIMRDHPFGVGWNKTVEIYEKSYSPPPGGAAAIVTNDYLMLGTQVGIPALLCFLAYVALCFRSPRARITGPKSKVQNPQLAERTRHRPLDSTQVACRAGALSMLVAFWFDGGLFKLPTSAVFWILLELGAARSPARQPSPQPAIASPDKT